MKAVELPSTECLSKAKKHATNFVKSTDEQRIKEVKDKQTEDVKRVLVQLSEPGASSWLGALPLEAHGFDLTKSDFRDAISMRYNKPLKDLPSQCPCGANFNVTHALNCHRGGFVNMRHDNIRDFTSNLLKTVVHDVEVEPKLHVVNNKQFYNRSAITNDDARLDIRARGFWRSGQNSFFDVRVTNADCSSQQNMSLKAILRKHELEKKRGYNKRIMEEEHGSFTPLIFTTTGVMGHECDKFYKCLAEKVSEKQNEKYSDVVRFLRVKLSYMALKSTLICLRGSRVTNTKAHADDTHDFGMSLIDLRVL